jgi:hypothetical protein
LLVAGLGAQLYGAWRVLWRWTGHVWGPSGRSARALPFAIANRQWTASTQQKRELVGAAVVVWLLFVPLLLAEGALGIGLAPVLLDVPEGRIAGLRVAAVMLLLDALAVTVVALPRSTPQGESLGYVRMSVTPLGVGVHGEPLGDLGFEDPDLLDRASQHADHRADDVGVGSAVLAGGGVWRGLEPGDQGCRRLARAVADRIRPHRESSYGEPVGAVFGVQRGQKHQADLGIDVSEKSPTPPGNAIGRWARSWWANATVMASRVVAGSCGTHRGPQRVARTGSREQGSDSAAPRVHRRSVTTDKEGVH